MRLQYSVALALAHPECEMLRALVLHRSAGRCGALSCWESDLARELNYSEASFRRLLKRAADLGFVEYQRGRGTKRGLKGWLFIRVKAVGGILRRFEDSPVQRLFAFINERHLNNRLKVKDEGGRRKGGCRRIVLHLATAAAALELQRRNEREWERVHGKENCFGDVEAAAALASHGGQSVQYFNYGLMEFSRKWAPLPVLSRERNKREQVAVVLESSGRSVGLPLRVLGCALGSSERTVRRRLRHQPRAAVFTRHFKKEDSEARGTFKWGPSPVRRRPNVLLPRNRWGEYLLSVDGECSSHNWSMADHHRRRSGGNSPAPLPLTIFEYEDLKERRRRKEKFEQKRYWDLFLSEDLRESTKRAVLNHLAGQLNAGLPLHCEGLSLSGNRKTRRRLQRFVDELVSEARAILSRFERSLRLREKGVKLKGKKAAGIDPMFELILEEILMTKLDDQIEWEEDHQIGNQRSGSRGRTSPSGTCI